MSRIHVLMLVYSFSNLAFGTANISNKESRRGGSLFMRLLWKHKKLCNPEFKLGCLIAENFFSPKYKYLHTGRDFEMLFSSSHMLVVIFSSNVFLMGYLDIMPRAKRYVQRWLPPSPSKYQKKKETHAYMHVQYASPWKSTRTI